MKDIEKKSLHEQLKLNALTKQQQFNRLVKEKNSFNRLNKDEIEYCVKLKTEELHKERELNQYLEDRLREFDSKRMKLQAEAGMLVRLPHPGALPPGKGGSTGHRNVTGVKKRRSPKPKAFCRVPIALQVADSSGTRQRTPSRADPHSKQTKD